MKLPVSPVPLMLLCGLLVCPAHACAAEGGHRQTGTAFVVTADGHLLTCAHVVKEATTVEVAIGGQPYDAVVVGVDEKHDLAVLKIEASGLPSLPLGDSSAVQLGQEARAFGFPLASVLGDSLKATRGTLSGIQLKEEHKILQTDAPVNSGNSGGPLVNNKGEVVGIVNAKLAGVAVSNVAFAVPIDYAKPLLRAKGLKFGTQGAESDLPGPALVRRVSPAVALVTATTDSPELLRALGRDGHTVSSVAFSPDGKTLAYADGWSVTLCDSQTGELRRVLKGDFATDMGRLAFSPDNNTLAVSRHTSTVSLFDTHTWAVRRTLRVDQKSGVACLAFSPDGNTLASAYFGGPGSVRVWDGHTGNLLHTMGDHGAEAIAFSPDGKTLAGVGRSLGTIWDVRNGHPSRKLNVWDAKAVAFSPDGKLLAVGGSPEGELPPRSADGAIVTLWDLQTRELIRTLHECGCGQSVAFAPNSTTLATGGDRCTVKLWDIHTGDLKRRLKGHTGSVRSVVFSRDGKLLASRAFRRVILWDLTITAE